MAGEHAWGDGCYAVSHAVRFALLVNDSAENFFDHCDGQSAWSQQSRAFWCS
jgi:hypothetical protein